MWKREEGRSAASQAPGGGTKGGEEWGVRPWGCHTARGLAPTGGRRPDRILADCDPGAARAGGVSLFRTGARRGSLRAGPGGSGSGRERSGTSGARARVGRPEKKKGWSSPDKQYGFGFI
jgi:hypothetical protein